MRDDQAEPELAYIAYETFLGDVDLVARKLEGDSWTPDFLVGVGRGGLVPAAFLSHRLDITMLSVDLSSGDADFSDELIVKLAGKTVDGRRILIIDDINDSGMTIASFRDALATHGGVADCVRVAVLINNLRSRAAVDYWSREIDRDRDKRWFVFPWEAQADRRTLVEEAVAVPERLA
jgi:hypoxanthine phosphoribosyltransferase